MTPPTPLEIQAQFDSGASFVYIPSNIYIFQDTLRINKGCKVYCQPGSVFIWTLATKKNSIEFADGVNFEATGCKVQIAWNGGAFPEDFDDGTLALYGVKDVTITGGLYQSALVDGIFVGWHKTLHNPCERVLIRDVTCDSGRRQGISVVSAKGLTVKDSKFLNTKGASPQAGVDIEPEGGCTIKDIVFKNCHSQNNASHAYLCNFTKLKSTDAPINVMFDNCTGSEITNGTSIGVVGFSKRDHSNPVKGKVNFNNCFTWENV